MRTLIVSTLLFTLVGGAHAQCNKQIEKAQKVRRMARLDWTAAGRTWHVALTWKTKSVSDNGEEEATAVLAVWDNLQHPTIGDFKVYDLTPDRCFLGIDPQLSTVKLMGRDFLLVTVPDGGGGGGSVVVATLYTIDEKGRLATVLHSAYRARMWSSDLCRDRLRSYVRAENADGSRIAWVYEHPTSQWVRKKSDCPSLKLARVARTYSWINRCFPADPASDPTHSDRLITQWDEEQCLPGIGVVPDKPRAAPTLAPSPSPDAGRPDAGVPAAK